MILQKDILLDFLGSSRSKHLDEQLKQPRSHCNGTAHPPLPLRYQKSTIDKLLRHQVGSIQMIVLKSFE